MGDLGGMLHTTLTRQTSVSGIKVLKLKTYDYANAY